MIYYILTFWLGYAVGFGVMHRLARRVIQQFVNEQK